ncbi:MAG: hypothetical protein ACOC28_00995 [Alkalispirochaetaceae bacterium]
MVTQTSLQNVSLSSILRARYGSGPVSLPMRGGMVYARFKHVQGVPSRGEGGFTISRLRALDNLIDRLSRLKGARVENSNLESEAVDRRIDELSRQLNQELAGLDQGGFSSGWKTLATGALVDLLA